MERALYQSVRYEDDLLHANGGHTPRNQAPRPKPPHARRALRKAALYRGRWKENPGLNADSRIFEAISRLDKKTGVDRLEGPLLPAITKRIVAGREDFK